MTIQEHADAVLALLRATANLTVYPKPDSAEQVPALAEPPYVSVYVVTRYTLGPSMAAKSSRAVTTVTCHCVGASDDAARGVAQKVSGALLDVTPVIVGRRCWPIRQDPVAAPPRPDESTGRLVMDLVQQYRLQTDPG